MQEIEFILCERFHGFNLYNLDETDIETLLPFIQYLRVKSLDGKSKNGNTKYKDGKQYKKVTAKQASWVNSIF